MASSKDLINRRRNLILPLLKDKSQGVRKCASRALEKLETRAEMETWIHYLRESGSPEKRVKALTSLAPVQEEDAFDAIAATCQDPDESVRVAAVKALRSRNEDQVSEILTELMEDPSPIVRSLTAEAIGMKRDRNLVPYLLAHLSDQNQEVLEQVVTAIGKLGDPVAEKPLTELLAHPVPKVRGLAALALGDLDAPGG